jgi:hypothetical protein
VLSWRRFVKQGKDIRKMMKALLGITLAASICAAQGKLERMPYNHPDGVTDLSVGIWANPLVMDYDGDGDEDLAVTSPDTPYKGTHFFENPTPKGRKEPMPVFKRGRQVTDARDNVAASYVDGKCVVLTPARFTDSFQKDGFSKMAELKGIPANVYSNGVRGNVWRVVDYDGDGKKDIVIGVGDWKQYGWADAYNADGVWTNAPLRGFVYWVKNRSTGVSSWPAAEWAKPELVHLENGAPMEVFGNPMPMAADWDGDGDLDILCGEFRDGFTYFENVGTRTAPKYAAGRQVNDESRERLHMNLEMIRPTAFDWDGDGDLDIICGEESGRVAFIENLGEIRNHVPVFRAPRFFKQQMDDVYFGVLATPCGCDWDGDGDWDLICGNSAGYIGFIENLSGKGVAHPKWAEPVCLQAGNEEIRVQAGINGSIQGPAEAKWGYTVLSVADWDGDGLPDIMINSILGDIVWYRNIGTRAKPVLAPAQAVEVEWAGAQPALAWGWRKPRGKALLTQWRTSPVMSDWNGDGLMDLVMLDQQGFLCFFERAMQGGKRILLAPKRVFCNERGEALQLSTGRAGASGRRKLCLVDWNGDGKVDIIANSVNAEVWLQTGTKDGKWLFKNTGNVDTRKLAGHTTCPTTVDFDNDGIPDLLIGAEDGYFYTMSNPRSKAAK